MIKVDIKSQKLLDIVRQVSFPNNLVTTDDINSLCKSHANFPPSVLCFKVINSDTWLFATDPLRSIPIFYSFEDNHLSISDTTIDLISDTQVPIDHGASIEFLTCGYTSGSTTLLSNIKQLQAGEYLWVDQNEIKCGFYHRFLSNTFRHEGIMGEKETLKNIFKAVFCSLVEQLNGRTAVIPLSGGYDSRLIVYWLHTLKYTNIICFTYGRLGNIEIENARKTAEKLNLKWIFIDYNKLQIKNYLETKVFSDYFQYMSNHSSMFFMQEYFAVKYLKEMSLIPVDAVFIPGHTGDTLGGSHLNSVLGQKLSKMQIINEIAAMHYTMVEVNDKEKEDLLKKIEMDIADDFPAHLIAEDWNFRERQSKFIVNSARVYSFFGYEYFLPLWDDRLITFFKHLPFEYRLNKKLYNSLAVELFESEKLNFSNELQLTMYIRSKQALKKHLIHYFPFLKLFKRLSQKDPICYFEITSVMKADMQQKRISIRRINSYNGLIVQWYLIQL